MKWTSLRRFFVLPLPLVLAQLALAGACSFPDYQIRPDAPGAAGAVGAAGAGGAPEPEPLEGCGTNLSCAPAIPSGWIGPVVWGKFAPGEDKLSDCPTGYGSPMDLPAELSAAPASCSCACELAGQTCDGVGTVSFYFDQACKDLCASTPASDSCTQVSGCGSQGSIRVVDASPQGARCQATTTVDELPKVEWQRQARICLADPAERGSCSGARDLCVPTPPPPFYSTTCVMRIVDATDTLPECPSEYQGSRVELFSDLDDQRDCSPCTCQEKKKGSCIGTVGVGSSTCNASLGSYDLSGGCQPFALSAPPWQVQSRVEVVPSTCGIAEDTQPTGSVVPGGPITLLCCHE